MIGFDLTQDVPVEKQRAMMQRDKNFGWLTPDNQVVVLQPGQDITTYQYDSVTHKMTPLQLDESIVTRAHANAMWGVWHSKRISTPHKKVMNWKNKPFH